MRLSKIVGLLGSVHALPLAPKDALAIRGYQDVETAARIARTLVARESLTNLNTLDSKTGFPVGFVEYYADCQHDGQPMMLTIDISSSSRNIEAGSNSSLTIRVGDHQQGDQVDTHYKGEFPFSVAGSPRVNLKGRLVDYEATQQDAMCFALRHHDSRMWFPGNPVHDSHWSKFEVQGVYFVGGFGDRAYIGEIPVDEYLAAKPFRAIRKKKKQRHRRSRKKVKEDDYSRIWSAVNSVKDYLYGERPPQDVKTGRLSQDEYFRISQDYRQQHGPVERPSPQPFTLVHRK